MIARPWRICVAGIGIATLALIPSCAVDSTPSDRVVVVSPTDPNVTGTLVLSWSIDGLTDPSKCSESASATIQINVRYSNDGSAGTFEQDCGAFATSIVLDRGDYTASAVLLDSASQPRTTTVNVRPFSILGNDQLNIPIYFPADAFFQTN